MSKSCSECLLHCLMSVARYTTNTNVENLPTSATHRSNHSTISENEVHSCMTTHPSTINDGVLTTKEPIRRSQRIHSLRKQRET